MAKYRVYREPVVQPLDQSIKHIALTKGQVAIVDAADYDLLITSGCTGVYFHKRDKVYGAYINRDGKRKYLGHFPTKEQAISARKDAEPEYHGEFAFSKRHS